jgi:hypothetical protein
MCTDDLRKEAREACFPMNDPEDSFKYCRKVVDVKKLQEICIKDYCAAARSRKNPDEAKLHAMCHAFSTLAYQCSENFLNVEWRRADRCRKFYHFKISKFKL